jgi:hypothetical protein
VPVTRRTWLTLELLEDRLTPSTGLPAISGPANTPEGALYTLQLDAQGATVKQWTIDWGDGAVDTVAGSATSAGHVYEDGPAGHTITATAVQAANLALFQWDPSAGGNGHYYGLTSTAETWLAAEAEAVALGGHLASITSQAEQNFIVNTFLSGANNRNIEWLGLNDEAALFTFVWSSGEPVTYTNWQGGEPNNFKGVERYVAINWHYGHFIGGGVLGSWSDMPLNGLNSNATQSEPVRGIMEFASPPVVTTVCTLQVKEENVPPRHFFSFDSAFRLGEQLARGDLNGDKVPDLVFCSRNGQVTAFDGKTGRVLFRFAPFGSQPEGLTVALADVNRDGRADLILSPVVGSGLVKVYSGRNLQLLRTIDTGLSGVQLTVGDVTGDGVLDLIVGSGPGPLGGRVRIFKGISSHLLAELHPYGAGYHGEVYVAAGDLTGDGIADVLTLTHGRLLRAFRGPRLTPLLSLTTPSSTHLGSILVPLGTAKG